LGILIPWLALMAHAQPAAPIVVLIGIPGSGRAEQASLLQRERHMAVISADDLIKHHPEAFEKSRNSPISGFDPRLDPAMNGLVEEALRSSDRSKGLVLAGYPASKAQGDYLVLLREKLNLPKAIVIHLVVPDDVARKQLRKEKVPDVEQQIINYHRELDFARIYFPQADIHDIKANRKSTEVAKDIQKFLPE
jgi:adenylate kinase family enzyme